MRLVGCNRLIAQHGDADRDDRWRAGPRLRDRPMAGLTPVKRCLPSVATIRPTGKRPNDRRFDVNGFPSGEGRGIGSAGRNTKHAKAAWGQDFMPRFLGLRYCRATPITSNRTCRRRRRGGAVHAQRLRMRSGTNRLSITSNAHGTIDYGRCGSNWVPVGGCLGDAV